MNMADIVKQSVNLFSLPEVYLRLKQQLEDGKSNINQLAETISCDPALSASLLRMANSAFFGIGQKVDTVSKAANLLGTMQVHDLALAGAVAHAFKNVPESAMNMKLFWHNSVSCAVIARLLAARCNVLDGERLFVVGLLHDIGHLTMYQKIPDAMYSILTQAKGAISLYKLERKVLGFSYEQLGAELLKTWNMGDSLVDTVRYHTEPEKSSTFGLQTAIVHVASVLTGATHLGLPGGQISPSPFAMRLTGLNIKDMATLLKQASEHTSIMEAMLFPSQDPVRMRGAA